MHHKGVCELTAPKLCVVSFGEPSQRVMFTVITLGLFCGPSGRWQLAQMEIVPLLFVIVNLFRQGANSKVIENPIIVASRMNCVGDLEKLLGALALRSNPCILTLAEPCRAMAGSCRLRGEV